MESGIEVSLLLVISSNLRAGSRIKISGNVNSEHKLNDLSSDYTDNVAAVFSNEFQVNRLPFFNIQSKGKALTAGPYRATGSNPNGPGYIIVKQIKLYFSVLYDFYLTGE